MRITIAVRAIVLLINNYRNNMSLKSYPPNPHIQSRSEP